MRRANFLTRFASRMGLLALLGAGLGSCTGGGAGIPPLSVLLFNFAPGFAGVRLNAPLELTFSTNVDPDTITSDSVRILTTTTTTQEPDPGAPAIGEFVVVGAVVRFLPKVPEKADISDAGLRIGFTYTIQVPSSPDVIEPVRTIEGDPNQVTFTEFFTTLNSTILPAPGDITAEPNLSVLHQFFIDEGIENGVDPCQRRDSRLAMRAARLFTYQQYLQAVSKMLGLARLEIAWDSPSHPESIALPRPFEAAGTRSAGSYAR
jgi:hypothetical protein